MLKFSQIGHLDEVVGYVELPLIVVAEHLVEESLL
jgi:hypothetical protein